MAEKLSGTLTGQGTLSGTLTGQGTLKGGLSLPNARVVDMDYNNAINKPLINNETVEGDKIGVDYHLQDKMEEATVQEIEAILYLP